MSTGNRTTAILLAAVLACSPGSGTVAASAPATDEPVEADGGLRQSLLELQVLDRKVADVAWRLAGASNGICPETSGALGIGLHSAAQYVPSVRPAAIAAFGFGDGYPAVLSLAEGSPAQLAGMQPGDRITAIDGIAIAPDVAPTDADADYAGIEALTARIEAMPAGAAVSFGLLRGEEPLSLSVVPRAQCRVRVELVPGNQLNAGSGENVVQVKGKLAAWVRGDDELALVVAHEMAHIFLRHHRRLDDQGISTGLFSGFGGNGRRLRDMERDADRVGIFIAARAGYDYRIAGEFWRRLSKSSGLGGIFAGSHPSSRNRARHAEAAVAEIEALQRRGLDLVP